jgi:predicted amidohydrolase
LLAIHRKVHLFDIDVPGKIKFQESEVLTGGQSLTEVDTEYGKLGVAICYDVRFPEMAMIAARRGAIAMIYPGAFNLTYGDFFHELTFLQYWTTSLGASCTRTGSGQSNICRNVLSCTGHVCFL